MAALNDFLSILSTVYIYLKEKELGKSKRCVFDRQVLLEKWQNGL